MAPERFEMRIDSELLERLDSWRSSEEDNPSRAEAVRRLLEAGLAYDNMGRAPRLSDGEKLIAAMLSDLIKSLKIDTDTNVDLVRSVIYGGHYWALGWEMPGIFHGHVDNRSRVTFVVDVLDMWTLLEEAFDKLSGSDKVWLEREADPLGKHVRFPGFDGNNESEYLSITRFLIHDLQRFSRFRDDGRDLNSHHPTLETYRRMFRVFEPLRKSLTFGKSMTAKQIAEVINARRAG